MRISFEIDRIWKRRNWLVSATPPQTPPSPSREFPVETPPSAPIEDPPLGPQEIPQPDPPPAPNQTPTRAKKKQVRILSRNRVWTIRRQKVTASPTAANNVVEFERNRYR